MKYINKLITTIFMSNIFVANVSSHAPLEVTIKYDAVIYSTLFPSKYTLDHLKDVQSKLAKLHDLCGDTIVIINNEQRFFPMFFRI